MCCVTAWRIPPNPNVKFVLDWIWVSQIPYFRFCPLFGIDEDYRPSCLIYEFRPKVCRDFVCEPEKLKGFIKHFIR
jgi:hypothetical protein